MASANRQRTSDFIILDEDAETTEEELNKSEENNSQVSVRSQSHNHKIIFSIILPTVQLP